MKYSLILLTYYREKVFSQFNGYIITAYCFDYYPFVSNNNSAVSRHFVGFKMYNVNDTDITVNVTSIKSDERPIVTFPVKEEANAKWVTCKRFDIKKNTTTLSDTSTTKDKDTNGNEYINCTLSVFGEVTIGNEESSGSLWLIILLIVAGVALFLALEYFIISLIKKRKPASQIISPLESPSPLLNTNE